MTEEGGNKALEELKAKYPNIPEAQLLDIIQEGVEKGVVSVEPAASPETHAKEEEPEFDILKLLSKGETDLNQILTAMYIENLMKERFGKGKEMPAEIKELLEKAKTKEGSSMDKLLETIMKYDFMESIMDSRRAKKQPQQPQSAVDVEKTIREIGDKMTEALRTHKLEDEKARAQEISDLHKQRADAAEKKLADRAQLEEDEQRLSQRVRDQVSPLRAEVDRLMKIIGERLQNVEPEKRKDLVLDLGQMISEELGEEIRDRVIGSVKSAFGDKEDLSATISPDGKVAVDWFKLGERGLKTLERFIDKLPLSAPAKRDVKPMTLPEKTPEKRKEEPKPPPETPVPSTPKPKPPPESPGTATAIVVAPTQTLPEAVDHVETPIVPTKPAEEPKPEKGSEKPIILEKRKEEEPKPQEVVETAKNESAVTGQSGQEPRAATTNEQA